MPAMTLDEWNQHLITTYNINTAELDKIAARLLWCDNRADPCPDDVEWADANEQTRCWYQNRVMEVLDEYLRIAKRN